jgi:hypothetical protein
MQRALYSILAMAFLAAGAVKLARLTPQSPEGPVPPSAFQVAPMTNSGDPTTVHMQIPQGSQPASDVLHTPWGAVEDPDYRRYLANLRSLGCPEPTIADIIAADVHGLYEARRQEGSGMSPRIGGGNPAADLKLESGNFHRALWDEEASVVKALLPSPPEWWRTLISEALSKVHAFPGLNKDTTHGKQDARALTCPKCLAGGGATDSAVVLPGTKQMARSTLPEILRAKSGALSDWHRRKEESNRDLAARRERLGPSPELLAEQEQLETAAAIELNQLLTPSEREEYDFHYSPVAQDLRNRLQGVSLDEEELRTLVHVQSELDGVMSGVEISGEAFLKTLQANRSEMARILGPDKWQEITVRGELDVAGNAGGREPSDSMGLPEPEAP